MEIQREKVEIVTVNGTSIVSCTSDDDIKSLSSFRSGKSFECDGCSVGTSTPVQSPPVSRMTSPLRSHVSSPVSRQTTPQSGEEFDDLDSLPPSRLSCFIRGSDPRIATCRGKLQSKRSKLNQEINKELRLRAGAENLFKATTNRKLKETVALELSFVNSNLQLLKEQLAELNSSVELYQNEVTEPVIPMIPLGLKETKEIDFKEPFKDFILEHYSEDASLYEDAITDLMDLRQAMRTPLRDLSGISLLFQYYNQLYFVDRRFFPPDRSLGIFFEWFDSLTGVPSCQRTVAFEKACVLFNMAAVYTQIGVKQDRMTRQGLDNAIDNFLRAAGVFKYICDNFTNAPSMDLNAEMLEMLGKLMMAQAKECLLEKLELDTADDRSLDLSLELCQEASHVADNYRSVLKFAHPVKDFIPYSWVALMSVKQEYYTALAHRHIALGLLDVTVSKISEHTLDTIKHIHREPDPKTQLDIRVPKDDEDRILLGRAHLRECLLRFEEAQRHHRMCRDLKNKPGLEVVLKQNQAVAMEAFNTTEDEDDFREVLDPPPIFPMSKFQLSSTAPDFSQHRVQDLFNQLGPCAIFSAKHYWTAPRVVRLLRMENEDFGFTIRGGAPAAIAGVEPKSLSDYGGMKEGDLIVGIGDEDVKWAPHGDVVELIKDAGARLTLKLVTPMDKNYSRGCKNNKKGSVSGSSSSSGISSNSSWTGNQSIHSTINSTTNGNQHNWAAERNIKKLTWNPFKKHSQSALDLSR